MLFINETYLKKFERIKETFLSKTIVPEKKNWKTRSNNDIWLQMIIQVIVVGRSDPGDKFQNNEEVKKRVSYETLLKIQDEEQLAITINKALRDVGTRYASSDLSKCKKTNALVRNFEVLRGFKEGPKELFDTISTFEGEDIRKVKYLMRIFSYIQSKSARDLLMELGIIRNAIALDSRLQNVFKKIGIAFPKGFETKVKLYDEIEHTILEKICKPLGIEGIQLDRMLYQNDKNILEMDF